MATKATATANSYGALVLHPRPRTIRILRARASTPNHCRCRRRLHVFTWGFLGSAHSVVFALARCFCRFSGALCPTHAGGMRLPRGQAAGRANLLGLGGRPRRHQSNHCCMSHSHPHPYSTHDPAAHLDIGTPLPAPCHDSSPVKSRPAHSTQFPRQETPK